MAPARNPRARGAAGRAGGAGDWGLGIGALARCGWLAAGARGTAGAVAGEDSTDAPSPVVQEDGAVCFKTADDATAVVSIGAGSGAYAVQVWGD